ncbi:MAG: alpha-E domain-containing protein [Oscillospiraceae bacterium]|nr:alpha-E domain-containing protein [Oscillospiraceae bacterium]MCD8331004.1 alpha-E domain-containing protein [Oscillospiraceae bacterium]
MGTFSLSQQNRLFWLGRYSERVRTTVQFMLEQYDRQLDGTGMDYPRFCKDMGIPCIYDSAEDFCRRYLFDADDPSSIRSSVEAMLGNGMVLRETISTPTLAYLQMAHSAMEMAAHSESPSVELQWVIDDIMAFRGSLSDTVESEQSRNIVKSGGIVERVSLMLRLSFHLEQLEAEMRKLLNRLYKTDLPVDRQALDVVSRQAMEGGQTERLVLLRAVESLFQI